MSLYAVTIERVIVLEADSEEEALAMATVYECQEAENDAESVDVHRVTKMEDVPGAWLGCYPYGGDGERTVLEYITGEGKTAP
jgi:hypothetical protein